MINHVRAGRLSCCAFVMAIAWLACSSALAEAPRNVRVLVVLRASEQPNHVYIAGMKHQSIGIGRTFGNPDHGRSRVEMLYTRVASLNNSFVTATSGYDRNAVMAEALRKSFAERSSIFEITSTTDAQKYLKGITLTLTDAARNEGFDFVVTAHDDFVGLATLDWLDADEGLLTPAYDLSYYLHDVADGNVRTQGKASSSGYLRQPADKASGDPALFTYLWPYLCTLNATSIVDELLRTDQLHAMAQRGGQGAALPPVAAKLADYEQRLQWKLKPASGWHEQRKTKFSWVLEPRDERAAALTRMSVDVDFLMPELGQGVSTVADYLPIYDRNRMRQAPRAKPLERFTDIAAPGYDAYRYVGQAGENNLVFFKTSGDRVMRIFTASIADDFEKAYPRLRGKIESMLAASEVRLN